MNFQLFKFNFNEVMADVKVLLFSVSLLFLALLFSVINAKKPEPAYKDLGLTQEVISIGGKIIVEPKSVEIEHRFSIEKYGLESNISNYDEVKKHYKESNIESLYENYVKYAEIFEKVFYYVNYIFFVLGIVITLSSFVVLFVGLFRTYGGEVAKIGFYLLPFGLFFIYIGGILKAGLYMGWLCFYIWGCSDFLLFWFFLR